MNTKSVLIIGGGFAGVEAALFILNNSSLDITLVSDRLHLEYYPAVFRIMRGAPRSFAEIPLVEIFKKYIKQERIRIVNEATVKVDVIAKKVVVAGGKEFAGDYLVLATGSQANYFNIEGVEQTTMPLRRAADVVSLMKHAEHMFATHVTAPKEEQVVALRFVIIGGGPSGVELASELAFYTKELSQKYKIDHSYVTIDLVEAREKLLSVLPQKVSDYTLARLRKLGVNFLFNRTVVKNNSWTLQLADSHLGARTVVWTAGIEVSEISKKIEGLTYGQKNKISVTENLEAVGQNDVFVAGDIADTAGSGLAQGAIAHGKIIGQNIVRRLHRRELLPYKASMFASAVPLGNWYAVFSYKNLVLTGPVPWLLRSVIDFHYLLRVTSFRWIWKNVIKPTCKKG
jgi:NADH dehydrogenase